MSQEQLKQEHLQCDEAIQACEKQLNDLKSKKASLEPLVMIENQMGMQESSLERVSDVAQAREEEAFIRNPKKIAELNLEAKDFMCFGGFFSLLFLSSCSLLISYELYEGAVVMAVASLFPLHNLNLGFQKWIKAHGLHKKSNQQPLQSHWKQALKESASRKRLWIAR